MSVDRSWIEQRVKITTDPMLGEKCLELLKELKMFEDMYTRALQAANAMFQTDDNTAPFRHLLKPGDNLFTDGFPAMAKEIERLNKVIQIAVPIVTMYARANPKFWSLSQGEQDPLGAHEWLEYVGKDETTM